MNLQWNIETFITITAAVLSLIGSYFIVRLDWKRYGLLFIISGVVGNILCYVFVKLGFYSFPYSIMPQVSNMPVTAILTVFPFAVLFGVRYSPQIWAWKIPFYWGIVHLGMLGETLAVLYTDLIKYNFKWDFWDSYTWWWIFLLGFEWIGGLIIPGSVRSPLKIDSFRYGGIIYALLHFIFILTVFLGGVYLGTVIKKELPGS